MTARKDPIKKPPPPNLPLWRVFLLESGAPVKGGPFCKLLIIRDIYFKIFLAICGQSGNIFA